ncbi:uncharacterized protein LOC8268829 isoform X1 [Ricinus communis]|uniref:Uncharacterized protein n=1 Tax=Ricinus communis TaxID=3988 RepID=B9SB96_RICCO|nr:uncharacterized protein LOC8268829 isoform X1 [Ricinus communis]EEF39104.1 conserved hypothetical protein [Ricinus communis]
MSWRKEYLDLVLVPTGLLIMCCYHLYLLYRCLKFPETTIIGYENHCRRAWVERVLQVEAKERGLYLAVINSTITASTFLASTSLALSSIIGTWVGSSSHNIFQSSIIYGNTSSSMVSIKYISLLICFLVAFASFLQCVRSLVHANFLISMPNSNIPVSYVQKAVIRGSVFWSVGLRAIYFATNLLLWIFGPIPMLVASLVMVVSLNTLDSNSTPLHQFESASEIHTLFRRIGKEITAVEQKTVQHNRQHDKEGKESKSSDHTISPQTISG